MDKISLLIQELSQTKDTDNPERLLDELSKLGEEVIQKLQHEYLNVLPYRKGKRIYVMKILQRMGYPKNESAIPFMVGIVSDINSPGWELAIQELVKIGSPVIPEIKEALQYYSSDYVKNDLAYQGLCILLKEIGTPIINPLKTDLAMFAQEGTDNLRLYLQEVLDLFQSH